VHRLPAYREGLATSLRAAGFRPSEASSTHTLVDACPDGVLLAEVARAPKPVLERLAASTPELRLVALTASAGCDAYRAALRLGFHGAVAEDAQLVDIVGAILDVIRGQVALPLTVARALAGGGPDAQPRFSSEHVLWLRLLAEGRCVASIARTVGYSERQMYRRLRQLYEQLGARGRGEAIERAVAEGLLHLGCGDGDDPVA